MYLDMADAELDKSLKDPKTCDFCTFRYVLSGKILKYNPVHRKYAGGARMQRDSQHNSAQRKMADESATQSINRGRPSSVTSQDPR